MFPNQIYPRALIHLLAHVNENIRNFKIKSIASSKKTRYSYCRTHTRSGSGVVGRYLIIDWDILTLVTLSDKTISHKSDEIFFRLRKVCPTLFCPIRYFLSEHCPRGNQKQITLPTNFIGNTYAHKMSRAIQSLCKSCFALISQ